MIKNLPSLEQLIRLLQHIPHVPSKNIFRIADFFLSMTPEQIDQFCTSLKNAHTRILPCKRCFFLAEQNALCEFCSNQQRNQKIVCVVENWQDLLAIEKTNAYEGVYHVMGGALSPLDGITADQLHIEPLVERVKNDQIEEIILCTNQTPEGEATAMYIARKLKGLPVTISCLARGLPVGSHLGASDRLTVYKALTHRRPF